MSVGSAKDLWQAYTALRLWAATNEGQRVFQLKDCSMEEDTEIPSPPSDAASSKSEPDMIILGYARPSSAPFQNRALLIEMRVPQAYPSKPPSVYLRVPLRHPNVDKDGQICTDLLDVDKTYDKPPLAKVVAIIVALLDQPEISHTVDVEATSWYENNRQQYDQKICNAVTAINDDRVLLIAPGVLP